MDEALASMQLFGKYAVGIGVKREGRVGRWTGLLHLGVEDQVLGVESCEHANKISL